jgi:hypothetical protein
VSGRTSHKVVYDQQLGGVEGEEVVDVIATAVVEAIVETEAVEHLLGDALFPPDASAEELPTDVTAVAASTCSTASVSTLAVVVIRSGPARGRALTIACASLGSTCRSGRPTGRPSSSATPSSRPMPAPKNSPPT